MNTRQKIIIVTGGFVSLFFIWVVVTLPPEEKDSSLYLGLLLMLGLVSAITYVFYSVLGDKNKKLLLLRTVVSLIDIVFFYLVISFISGFFPGINNVEFFIIGSIIVSIFQKIPFFKRTLGERIFRLKRERLDFDVSLNIKFWEIPLRMLSFFLPLVYVLRLFWVEELKDGRGWIDKGMETKIVLGNKIQESAKHGKN